MPRISANGLEFEYESFGWETNPPVLLIMGLGAQMTVWPQAFCEGLAAKGFRVVRYDNRDAGKSTHLSNLGAPNIPEIMAKRAAGETVSVPYRLEDMAADALGILRALDVRRAHIIGASMGGMIAQVFTTKYPDHVLSLTSIMSTTGNPFLPQAKPEALAAIMSPPASDSREDRIAAGMSAWRVIGSPGYPATDEELRANVTRDIDRAPYDPAGVARQMAAIVAAPARDGALKEVICPALVLHGADDPLVPVEGGIDTATSIPGSKLVIVPGMGHDVTDALVPVFLEHIVPFITEDRH
jgi:pimeloyl-ACP methyl ester carboxylesterase